MALLIILSFFASCSALEQLPSVQNAIVQTNIKILESNRPDKAKIAALHWLQETKSNEALKALPAIEALLKGGYSQELRSEAATCLGSIPFYRKMPCPLSLIVAMLDPDEEVAFSAASVAGAFKQFPENALDLILKCAESKQKQVRSHAVCMLMYAGSKDKRVLDALEHALSDSSPTVRNNSQVRLYALTNNFERYLKYLMLVQIDKESVFGKVDSTTKAAKLEQEAIELIDLGSKIRLIEWSENKAEEYSSTLLRIMKSDQPLLRGSAILAAKNCFIKFDLDWYQTYYTRKGGKPDKTKERRPKAAKLLWDADILGILQKIEADDPDTLVKRSAQYAIGEIKKLSKQ